MSWSIECLVNTVQVTMDCAEELFQVGEPEGYFYSIDDVSHNGKLSFNPDHMEHMDFIGDEEIQKVLKHHKVQGDIRFGSLEGDNRGKFWGYRFDGLGHMVPLEGELTWRIST